GALADAGMRVDHGDLLGLGQPLENLPRPREHRSIGGERRLDTQPLHERHRPFEQSLKQALAPSPEPLAPAVARARKRRHQEGDVVPATRVADLDIERHAAQKGRRTPFLLEVAGHVVRKMLPLRTKVIHCRWSGESTWIPMGALRLGLDFENHTSHPAPGMLLLYPGGISETEMLFPYGSTLFASKVGQLAGNHFAPI